MLSILTPTRERPKLLKTFIDSVYDTISDPREVQLLVYIDTDDPYIPEYMEVMEENPAIKYIIGEPKTVSVAWNDMAEHSTGNILLMGNDDQVYISKDWDKILLEKVKQYPDDIYVAWFEDGVNSKNHCAFPIISRTWYNTVGYFTPSIPNFCWNDAWVYDIGQRLNRCLYIPEVITEHRHFTQGKSKYDNTYKRVREGPQGNLFSKSGPIFNDTVNRRIEDTDKLRKVINDKSRTNTA